jgi:hypothetical protein
MSQPPTKAKPNGPDGRSGQDSPVTRVSPRFEERARRPEIVPPAADFGRTQLGMASLDGRREPENHERAPTLLQEYEVRPPLLREKSDGKEEGIYTAQGTLLLESVSELVESVEPSRTRLAAEPTLVSTLPRFASPPARRAPSVGQDETKRAATKQRPSHAAAERTKLSAGAASAPPPPGPSRTAWIVGGSVAAMVSALIGGAAALRSTTPAGPLEARATIIEATPRTLASQTRASVGSTAPPVAVAPAPETAPALAAFDEGRVRVALGLAIDRGIRSCYTGPSTERRHVGVTLAPSGAVDAVSWMDATAAASPAGRCLLQELEQFTTTPFAGGARTLLVPCPIPAP